VADDIDVARRCLLVEELKALRMSSEALLFAFDRVLNFGLVFAAAATGLALANGVTIILILLPFPIVVLFLVLLNLNTEGLSRAGHKKWVEEQLNALLGPTAIEEEHVAPTRKGVVKYIGRFSVFGTQLLLAILLVVLFAVGGAEAIGEGWGWALLFFLGVALSLGLLGIAASELARSYSTAYSAARVASAQALTEGQIPSS